MKEPDVPKLIWKIPYRLFRAWLVWLERQWDIPSRSDAYVMQLNAHLLSWILGKEISWKAMFIPLNDHRKPQPKPSFEAGFKAYRDDGTEVSPPEPLTKEQISQIQKDLRLFQIRNSPSKPLR